MKVLISGSRSITDEKKVFEILDRINSDMEFDLVIHGGASGVDSIATKWCDLNGIDLKIVRPINSEKISYLYRNCEMVGMCDYVIIIHDGISKGTKFVLDYVTARKKDHFYINVSLLNEMTRK